MQVFRPYVDWARSAGVLDDRRLGRQRVETILVARTILRGLGLIGDGKRGWLTHPIVQLYLNGGRPYLPDLLKYFYALVDEWERRGYRNGMDAADVERAVKRVDCDWGTPITHVHEVEYRRVLILKDPCHYLSKFSREEIEEVLATPPVPIRGINMWLFDVAEEYRRFIEGVRRGTTTCAPLFELVRRPRRRP